METSGPLANLANVLLPGLIIAIVTSVLTVRLSIRQFRTQKWWERKEQAYSNLLEIVHGYNDYTSKSIKDQEDLLRVTDEERQSWQAEWKEFNTRYAKARNLASLHLSNKAVSILDVYDADKLLASHSDNIFDWMESDLEASTKCLKKLIIAAKEDLGVK